MRILSWNCCGIGNSATVRELRDLAKDVAPSILFISETQISKSRVEGLRWTLGFQNCFAVHSSGRSGGLGVFWRNNVLLSLKTFSKYHVDVEVQEPEKPPWRLTMLYGEANRAQRHKTWDLLKFLRAESGLPWACIGDFNEVLRREDQIGPNKRDEYLINSFREAVDTCGLCDIGYVGLDWTWERRLADNVSIRVRLDRALADANWSTLFPFALIQHLTAASSDHSPILLITNREEGNKIKRSGEKIFRYEKMWESHEGLAPVIEQFWSEGGPCSTILDIHNKLSELCIKLQRWSYKCFGGVRSELKSLTKKLESLRSDPRRVCPCLEEKKIQERIVQLNYREEVMWRQRSRISWLEEGDKNTAFFHQKASRRKRKNHIHRLERTDGTLTEDVNEMKHLVTDFYQQLFSSEGAHNMEQVLDHVPAKVTRDMNNFLLAPFREQEVKEALFQMFPTKAPGPDGFPAHFFQFNWELCGKDVVRTVLAVLNGGDIPKELDMTKAYDRVEWSFLEQMMRKLGFHYQWAKGTLNCADIIRWMPPPGDCLKINVDAAISRSGNKGAVRAVCRDALGKFVAASAMVWKGLSDPTTLEALGCNEGLAIAMDCNASKVCIASDCQEVIKNIAARPKCKYLAVLNDIETRRSYFEKVEFRFESRCSNVDAHNLAKLACTLDEGRHVWLVNPPGFVDMHVNLPNHE